MSELRQISLSMGARAYPAVAEARDHAVSHPDCDPVLYVDIAKAYTASSIEEHQGAATWLCGNCDIWREVS